MKNHKVTYLSDLHHDHQQWLREILFWESELNYFSKQLLGASRISSKKEFQKKVDHFENLFLVHQEKIDALKHQVRKHEGSLSDIANAMPQEVDKKKFKDHDIIRGDMDIQKKLFRELKDEFYDLISGHSL